MIFLGLQLGNQLGMLPAVHNYHPAYLIRTVVSISGVWTIGLQAAMFLYENRRDFMQSISALAISLNVLMHAIKVIIGLAKNRKFLRVYTRLKSYYENPRQYQSEIRDRVDRSLRFYSVNIFRFVVFSCLGVIFTPLLVKGIEYYQTGAMTGSRWDLPIPFASPFFDFQSSPAYEVCYTMFAVAFTPLVLYVFSLAFLFMGIAVHINGLFMDLEYRFEHIGLSSKGRRVGRRKFRENYKNCIDFQNDIFEIVKDTEDVFANIFFVQFTGTIVIVCIQSYAATQNTGNGRLLSNVLYSVCCAGELFIFTICGSLIARGNELSIQALLSNDWFAMDPHIRRDFTFMVKRAQVLCRISFLNWIDCSLESLKFVVNSSFNMFTLLQHIARRRRGQGLEVPDC